MVLNVFLMLVGHLSNMERHSIRGKTSFKLFGSLNEIKLCGCVTCLQVTHKFRCMVRIIATCPSEVVDFCAPIDQASTNQEDGQQQKAYVYTVRLTLEDPTAHLHALLYGEDAVYIPSQNT